MGFPARRQAAIRRFSDLGNRLSLLPANLRGILWMLAAGLFFTVMVTLIKVLGQRLHVAEILLIRQVFMAAIVAPTILTGLPASLHTKRPWLHVLRVACAATAMFCGFTAVIHMPLADATAIGFSKTFFVTVLAIVFLGETVGRHRWAATVIGFAGVVIVAEPGQTGGLNPYAILAVIGALGASGVMILLRKLSQVDRPVTILTYQAVFVGILMAPLAIWNWLAPTPFEWLLLALTGAVSWAGQMCNIRAFRAGEASAIAAFEYVRLVYATLIGFVLFADVPGLSTLAGSALIVGAALYTALRERRLGRSLAAGTGGRGDPA